MDISISQVSTVLPNWGFQHPRDLSTIDRTYMLLSAQDSS
jgi:hypothetical protein